MVRNALAALGFTVLAFAVSLAPSNAKASDKETATKLVNDAAAYFTKNGKDKAVAEINNKAGQFVKGEVYVFAYDMNGVMVAHPQKPDLIGKNLLNTPDAEGKMFRKEIIETAKKGEGWVDYKYKNPETSKVEDKTTFVKKAGDLVICAGIYKK